MFSFVSEKILQQKILCKKIPQNITILPNQIHQVLDDSRQNGSIRHYRVEKKEEMSTLLFNILRVPKSYKILEIQVFRTPIC